MKRKVLGSDEELTRFCFDIYDLNEDGFISREEMMLLLKDCMFKATETQDEDGDEGVKVILFLVDKLLILLLRT